jgi:hypothetical protein
MEFQPHTEQRTFAPASTIATRASEAASGTAQVVFLDGVGPRPRKGAAMFDGEYNELGRGPDSLLRAFPAPVVEPWNALDPTRMISNTSCWALDAAEITGVVAMRDRLPAAAAGVHVVGWDDSAVVEGMALSVSPASRANRHLLTCDATDDESFDGDAADEQWLPPGEPPQDLADGTDSESLLEYRVGRHGQMVRRQARRVGVRVVDRSGERLDRRQVLAAPL